MAAIRFYKKDLCHISGNNERTFRRRIYYLKSNNLWPDTIGNYIYLPQALQIAEKLGFINELKQYVKENFEVNIN